MRFYKSDCLEHIGFDFYCDIANNIVKARKDMGLTQKELAKLAGIKEHRLVGIENVKIRIDLDDLEKLAKVFERTVDWQRMHLLGLAGFFTRFQAVWKSYKQANGIFVI
jgi:transcriptional regulator with XRE-family HTH domain